MKCTLIVHYNADLFFDKYSNNVVQCEQLWAFENLLKSTEMDL